MDLRYALLAFVVANAPSLSAQASAGEGEAIRSIDGAVAPAGTWYTRGGCASRSGATETLPVEGELAPAWTFTAEGTIDGEPLVWNQNVFVSSYDKKKKRAWIEWIDLETGQRLDAEDFKTERPLHPSIWRNRMVLRSGPKKLSFYRLSQGRFSKVNDYRSKFPLGEPLLFENQAFVIDKAGFVGLRSGRSKPDWRHDGLFYGVPSLRGDMVYGLEYSLVGEVHLVQLDRETGRERLRRLVAVYPDGYVGD